MSDEEIAAEQELLSIQTNNMSAWIEQSVADSNPISEEEAKRVTPFDLLSSSNYTTSDERDKRYSECKGCERFFKPTASCKECGCFMALKTWLKDASCPLGKW